MIRLFATALAALSCCAPGSDERPVTEHPTSWCWDRNLVTPADRAECFRTEWARGWDNGLGVRCYDIEPITLGDSDLPPMEITCEED